MQRIGLQIFSWTMSLLVLVSTVSWTVDQHICMGRVVSTAVFSEAAGCGMAMSEDNKCCDHKTDTLKGQDDLKHSEIIIAYTPVAIVVEPCILTIIKPAEVTAEISSGLSFHPPDPPERLHLMYQVFLI
jgi:hypothetical protein